MTHHFSGASEGFIVTYVIYDPATDTEGFVGFLPSDQSIYVVFRGSESIQNWLSDSKFLKTDYKDPNCVNCAVHEGFLTAENNVSEGIYMEVFKLFQTFHTIQVKTTGHSLGAALANLTAMALKKRGFNVSMINFG